MSIEKISQNTRDAIRRKSAAALPNNPTASGMRAEDIKKAFWQPLLDEDSSVLAELERVIEDVNQALEAQVTGEKIADGAITSAKLQDYTIGATKLQEGAVFGSILRDESVTAEKIAAGAVGASHLSAAAKELFVPSFDTGGVYARSDNGEHRTVPYVQNPVKYTIVWRNGDGLFQISDARQSNQPVSLGQVSPAIKGVKYNGQTGVLTFTTIGNQTITIDLPTESIIQTGQYDDATGDLVLEMINGEEIRIPATETLQRICEQLRDISISAEYEPDGNMLTLSLKNADGDSISSGSVDMSVGTSRLIDGAVSSVKIADNAVTTNKIQNSAVTGGKIASGAILPSHLHADTMALMDASNSSTISGIKTFTNGLKTNETLPETDNSASVPNTMWVNAAIRRVFAKTGELWVNDLYMDDNGNGGLYELCELYVDGELLREEDWVYEEPLEDFDGGYYARVRPGSILTIVFIGAGYITMGVYSCDDENPQGEDEGWYLDNTNYLSYRHR